MVGTSPTIRFSSRCLRANSFIQETVRMMSTRRERRSGVRGGATLAIKMNQIGGKRLGVQLPEHGSDLAAMVRSVIDEMVHRQPQQVAVLTKFQRAILMRAI